MSDEESYELLGFDNLLLPVGDLAEAVPFYERAGFTVGFRLDEAGIAILKVGGETPGVLLRLEDGLGHRPPPWPAPRVWLEVPDARKAASGGSPWTLAVTAANTGPWPSACSIPGWAG